jgi:hypothetical protein
VGEISTRKRYSVHNNHQIKTDTHTTSTTSCLLSYTFYTKLTYVLCLIPHRPQVLLLQPRHDHPMVSVVSFTSVSPGLRSKVVTLTAQNTVVNQSSPRSTSLSMSWILVLLWMKSQWMKYLGPLLKPSRIFVPHIQPQGGITDLFKKLSTKDRTSI